MTPYPPLYRSQEGYDWIMAQYDAALRHGPVPYTTCLVNTRYGQSHIVVGGPEEGRPLLLFHGWNGNAAGIGQDFPFLFDTYRVYMPDIIGHPGKSAANRPPTAGSTYADWAADVLDALNLTQAYVVGISGGGWMTLKLAAHYPQRVGRAVALSSDGLAAVNLWGALRYMLPVAIWPNERTAQWFLDFTTANGHQNPEQAEGIMTSMKLMRHFKPQGNPGQLTDQELGRLTAPLLLLMGEYERIFDPHQSIERARHLIPGLVAAEVVANAGHIMTADQPQWLAQRILAFLQDSR
jgi:pimeloyl-ACP methyl ester carboxylesterase